MIKYCHKCDKENYMEAAFCQNCGTKLIENIPANNAPVQQANNQSYNTQYYNQLKQYVPKTRFNKYKLIYAIVGVIGVVAILIGALFSLVVINGEFGEDGTNNSTVNKNHVAGGPTVNLQALANGGNTLTQPAEDHTAVYGYYMSCTKFGTISFTSQGEEYFQGETCKKIIGNGNFNIELYGYYMEMSFNINAYTLKSDESLAYCKFDFSVVTPISLDMDAIIDVDKENNELIYIVNNEFTGSTSTSIKVSDNYWSDTKIEDNLYVGFSKDLYYTVNAYGYDVIVDMVISVISQEDVTVGKGTFEDCYKVQIEQDESVIAYVWLTEEGICPKIQVGSGVSSTGLGEFSIELEEYYTTY
jgi:hypothetical protein